MQSGHIQVERRDATAKSRSPPVLLTGTGKRPKKSAESQLPSPVAPTSSSSGESSGSTGERLDVSAMPEDVQVAYAAYLALAEAAAKKTAAAPAGVVPDPRTRESGERVDKI